MLSIREARGPLGDAAQKLHGLYPERQALAVLALVHVEPGELADAVEAVADGVAVGEEAGGSLDGRGVVLQVGGEGVDEFRAVAGVVEDDRFQGLAVEGFELLRVLLEDPEEELVGSGPLEGRDGGGAVDAVSDLQRHLRLRVGVRKEDGVPLVAPDPDGDREVGQEALDVALHTFRQLPRQLRQLLRWLVIGRAQKQYDVVRAGAEEEVREELAGLEAHGVGQAPFQLLYHGFLRLAALQVAGEVVYVHDQDERSLREVGTEVHGALQEELDRSVVPVYQVVDEIAPYAELGLQAYTLLAELGFQDAPRPVQEDHVLRRQGLVFEVYPQVARRGAGSDRGPEELLVRHPPPLDGYGEVAVGEPGVAVPPLAARLFHPGRLRGPQAVFFEQRAQGVGLLLFWVRSAGDQASDRVFDHHGTAQQLRDAGREVPDGSLAARALE